MILSVNNSSHRVEGVKVEHFITLTKSAPRHFRAFQQFHVSVRPFSFLISHNGDTKVVVTRVKRSVCLNNAPARAACDEEEDGSLIQMEARVLLARRLLLRVRGV